MKLNEAFTLTMEFEGGGVLHEVPGDAGGRTKWGVSQRAYPDLDIERLDRATARSLFEADYWARVRADDLPEEIRWDVVDFAFNAGVGVAARTLQRSVNLCLQAHSRHDYLKLDGQIGPITLFHVDDYPPDRLRRVFRAYRVAYYLTLAEQGKSKFIHGWLRRVEGIHG